MKPKLIGSSSEKLDTPERIKEIAGKRGVVIHLDVAGDTETAKMGSVYSYDTKKQILLICLTNLNPADKPLLFQLIKDVLDSGDPGVRDTKEEVERSYKEYVSENKNKKVLEFFSQILSKDDYSALRMSLYLRDQKAKGKDIDSYKTDIRDKFGGRGLNISNLCSQGYFEDELMPLYTQVSKKDFNEYYELVVGLKARALFVNSHMDINKIRSAFDDILLKAQKYHLKEFRIHGIGKGNVLTIKKFVIEKQGEEDGYSIKKIYEDADSTAIGYTVEIV